MKLLLLLQGPKSRPRRDSWWGWGGSLPLCGWRKPNQVELRGEVTSVIIWGRYIVVSTLLLGAEVTRPRSRSSKRRPCSRMTEIWPSLSPSHGWRSRTGVNISAGRTTSWRRAGVTPRLQSLKLIVRKIRSRKKSFLLKLLYTPPVKPEIRKFPRFSKFAQNLMHQIELKCVVYGYPNVSIFWSKAGKQPDAERYIWNNKGLTKKVYEPLW